MKISRKKISEKNLDRPATARDFVNLKQDFTDFKTVTSRNFVNLKQDFADFKTVTAKDLQNFVTIDAFKRHMDIIDRRFVEFSERFVSRTEFHEAMDRIYTSLDRIFFLLENHGPSEKHPFDCKCKGSAARHEQSECLFSLKKTHSTSFRAWPSSAFAVFA